MNQNCGLYSRALHLDPQLNRVCCATCQNLVSPSCLATLPALAALTPSSAAGAFLCRWQHSFITCTGKCWESHEKVKRESCESLNQTNSAATKCFDWPILPRRAQSLYKWCGNFRLEAPQIPGLVGHILISLEAITTPLQIATEPLKTPQ